MTGDRLEAAVGISADPTDTPKDLYRRLGFRLAFLLRGYWRTRP